MTRDALRRPARTRSPSSCASRDAARKQGCCNANTNDSQPHDSASFFGSRAVTILRRVVYTTRSSERRALESSRHRARGAHRSAHRGGIRANTRAARRLHGRLRRLPRRRRPRPQRERARLRHAAARLHGLRLRRPRADSDWYAIAHRGGPIRGFDRLMPAFGEALQPEEIEAALAQIRSFCTDARWPRGELNLPRALFTEKAYPEDEAVITTTFVGEGPDSITPRVRLGATLRAVEPDRAQACPITRADLGDPEGWKSGTGDLGIGVKHTMRHSLERGAILAVGGELVLPTGDETKGFGKGTTVLESFVLYGKLLPRDAFVQFQGVLEFPNDSALEDEAVLRAALGKTWTVDAPFGRSFTPMLEVLAARELEGGAQTRVGPRAAASSLAEQTPACPRRRRDSPAHHRPREPRRRSSCSTCCGTGSTAASSRGGAHDRVGARATCGASPSPLLRRCPLRSSSDHRGSAHPPPSANRKISGMSSPCSRMYCLCSTSFSSIACFEIRGARAELRHAVDDVLARGGSGRGRSARPCRTASWSCPLPCSRARAGCRDWCAGRSAGGSARGSRGTRR